MAEESRSLIREGVVSVVYPERCSARVEFVDKDGLISAELPILQPCAFKNKTYSLPDVGETVLCLSPGNDDSNTGWIIGSRYHDKNAPPVNNQDISMMKFEDGTFIQYDRKRHELKISCTGDIYIKGKNIFLN